MKSIDVLVSAYDEEDCINELCERLLKFFNEFNGYKWRALVVDNGSHDETFTKLKIFSERDNRIKVIKLSRNFHMDGGLTAALSFAKADAVVLMAADLQDKPEDIAKFISMWEKGFHNVFGEVKKREGTSLLRRINSYLYYKIANKLTGGVIVRNASDFRLLDRVVYETLRSLDEKNRFVRALVSWTGFKSAGVPIERPPRFSGESKAYSLPVFGLAIRSIIAHSFIPIRVISILGFIIWIISIIAFIGMAFIWFTQGVPFAGFGTIVALIFIFFGTLGLMLGIVAEYIALIYQEVRNRPNFIVEEVIGL